MNVDKKVKKWLSSNSEHFELVTKDKVKVRCALTGHEMPAKLSLLKTYASSNKKFLRAKEEFGYDFKKHEPYIVEHKKFPGTKLYCLLTSKSLNKIAKEIEAHVNGKKYKFRKNAVETMEKEEMAMEMVREAEKRKANSSKKKSSKKEESKKNNVNMAAVSEFGSGLSFVAQEEEEEKKKKAGGFDFSALKAVGNSNVANEIQGEETNKGKGKKKEKKRKAKGEEEEEKLSAEAIRVRDLDLMFGGFDDEDVDSNEEESVEIPLKKKRKKKKGKLRK